LLRVLVLPACLLVPDCGAAADVVPEMLEGLCDAYSGLARLDGAPVVVRRCADATKVAILSGGGSGHEPAHAGYVGRGMLSAAVCGAVFASPSVAAVLAGIRAVATPAGVLVVVKNYTGDRLNFGLAAERAKAEDIRVELVIVGDDAALPPSGGIAGRRGLAGTVLVHKVAGAAAEAGLPLAAVAEEARAAAAALATVGVALTVAALPGCAPARHLPAGCCELGLGIHGEPGAETVQLPPADTLVERMLDRVLHSSYLQFPAGSTVVLLVNNLGGTPAGELAIVCRAAVAQLRQAGLRVVRLYCGAFMTSLDAAGVSLTLMRVDDERLLERLDASTDAPAWPHHCGRPGAEPQLLPRAPEPGDEAAAASGPYIAKTAAGEALRSAVRAASLALQSMEAQLGAWDAAVGDGDCGMTLAAGAAAVLEDLPRYNVDDASATAAGLAASVRRAMGGTSGVLYDIFFTAAAASLSRSSAGTQAARLSLALEKGVHAVAHLGGATQGMRTMLDALLPAAEAASSACAAGQPGVQVLDAAAAAAEAGADATRDLPALAGRSSYVPADVLRATPDPGAKAVAAWLRAAATAAANEA
jgi:dihydroxyacetone kinase